jgi:RNA polymerase sigma-70 factor, ECF subfamily
LNKEQISEFERLVKQNMKRAYFVALGFLGSHDSAMEVSQEAFIRAYRHFNKFDKSRNFFTWHYKILKNLCLNFIRDNKKKRRRNFLKSGQETGP